MLPKYEVEISYPDELNYIMKKVFKFIKIKVTKAKVKGRTFDKIIIDEVE